VNAEAEAREAVARRLTALVDDHGDAQAIEFVERRSASVAGSTG
jgi:hypothetical protein